MRGQSNASRSAVRSQPAAIGMVIVSAVLIAAVPSFGKLAYESGASVLLVVAVRFLITMLWLTVFLARARRGISTSARVFRLSLIGGIGAAAMSIGIISAIARIDLSLVILIVYVHPMFVAWIGHLRGTYELSRFRVFCCLLILLGLALALSVSFARLDALGVAFAFLGAIGATVMLIANGDAVHEGGSLIVNFYTAATALILVSIVGFIVGPMVPPGTETGWIGLLGMGTAFCLGLVLFLAAIPTIGVTRATLLSVLEPVMGILLAMLLFGDRLAAVQWAGVAVVIGGLLLLEIPLNDLNRLLGFPAAQRKP